MCLTALRQLVLAGFLNAGLAGADVVQEVVQSGQLRGGQAASGIGAAQQELWSPPGMDMGPPAKASRSQPDFEYATKVEGMSANMNRINEISTVPWNMKLGAKVMFELSNQGTGTPPPTQEMTDNHFVAQCPMAPFDDALYIAPARCGETAGNWTDARSGKPLMRWAQNGKGGISFGVDSKVSGPGSVLFADLTEKFSWSEYNFELKNCLGSVRFVIKEEILLLSEPTKTFYYKYRVLTPLGEPVAETGLFKQDQDEVNVTMARGMYHMGAMVAVARREGHWVQEAWRECGGGEAAGRRWRVEFPADARAADQTATVQDVRVISAMLVNLMAYRDEHVSRNGVHAVGGGHMLWTLIRGVFIAGAILLAVALAYTAFYYGHWDLKARKFCFKLEAFLLPRSSSRRKAAPPLQPVW